METSAPSLRCAFTAQVKECTHADFFFYALLDNMQKNLLFFPATPDISTCCSTGRRQQLRNPGATEKGLIGILGLLLELFLSSTPSFLLLHLALSFCFPLPALLRSPFQQRKKILFLSSANLTWRSGSRREANSC